MAIESGIPGERPAENAPATRSLPGDRAGSINERWPALVLFLLPWSWYLVRDLHWVFDPIAIALPILIPPLALVLALCAAGWRRRWLLPATASVVLVGLTAIVGPWTPRSGSAPEDPITVLAANLTAVTGEPFTSEVWPALRAQDADLVVLSEFNGELTDQVGGLYDHLLLSDLAEADLVGEESGTRLNRAFVGVFSRYPIERLPDDGDLEEGLPGLRIRVEGPAGPFVLYALHLPKPSMWSDGFSASFGSRDEVLGSIEALSEAESLPVVLAGDLNLSDRESGYRGLVDGLRDAMRQGVWAGPTSVKGDLIWRLLALRIDHLLVSERWCADGGRRVPLPHSDHRAVTASVGPCE